ncbi:putative nucleoside-diphosphate sugar epimerase [Rubrobacter radiotolerans]|nr:putative nucleoside-diphosphate sugar epimerase [Rubrobacter radiotolerans]SMC02777.1 NDP-sugar epimerase, includes UDP-GlcNAc-inverting 4,6-dehydratase FlaA1 and capsular polysaccharide biosynthesis protein EpsC [Rubrobacter radiotolerans DSM 5868]
MDSLGRGMAGGLRKVQRAFYRSPPTFRRAAAMLVDAAIVIESFVVALLFRFDGAISEPFWTSFWPFALLSAVLFVLLLNANGVYRSILRYTGIYQGLRIASATSIATGTIFLFVFAVGPEGLDLTSLNATPLSVVLVGGVLAYLQLVAVRLYPRVFYELSLREIGRRKRTLIVGTGEQGVALAGHIWRTAAMETQIVGFVADSEAGEDVGKHIEGVPVIGTVDEIERLIAEHGVDGVIIATPKASREQVDRIWRTCVRARAEVKVMPDLGQMLSEGTIRLRELQIEDLLGREPIDIDLESLSGYIRGRSVLVTGAGGSIGRELSRQISRLDPSSLVLFDRDESGLYYLGEELRREGFDAATLLVGDVTATERLSFIFERYRPELVFHAAAYKHVPMMELQATEAIVNNVFGTLNVARSAGAYGAKGFVNVSTDKAVNPANVMGATKRLAETICRELSREFPQTVFSSVRFGNVLGSRGSVIPTFRQQIEAGGPVTVTHPEMIRYFMTIPEAVSLILQAGALSKDSSGYATYMLEMGRPVRILDLARNMIEVMGATDVQVKFTGLRPGEKLSEELFESTSESQHATEHPMVYRLTSETDSPTGEDLMSLVGAMIVESREQEAESAIKTLKSAVPTYSEVVLTDPSPGARADRLGPS